MFTISKEQPKKHLRAVNRKIIICCFHFVVEGKCKCKVSVG